MAGQKERDELVALLNHKSGLKQDVYKNARKWFKVFKEEIHECAEHLKTGITDDRVRLKIEEKGEHEIHLFIGSDVLVFYLHTNIFKFSEADFATKTSYVKENPENAFCGIINVYDFLADSYEYNRPNDLGYLIARIFINREDHFIVEGKGQLGFLYRDFMHQTISKEILMEIIYRVSIYAIDFDLLTPPYQNVQQVSVYDMQTLTQSSQLKTGKRLGFKFQAEKNVKG